MTFAKINPAMYHGMLAEMDSSNTLNFGQFDYPINDDPISYKNSSTYIFMHTDFFNAISLDNKDIFKKIQIENEEYFYFPTLQFDELSQTWKPFSVKVTDDCIKMRIQMPKVIKVICSEIEPSFSTSGFQKILNVFTPNSNSIGTYIHKNFQNHIFQNTCIKELTKLNIQLLDEDDIPLQLDLGGT